MCIVAIFEAATTKLSIIVAVADRLPAVIEATIAAARAAEALDTVAMAAVMSTLEASIIAAVASVVDLE